MKTIRISKTTIRRFRETLIILPYALIAANIASSALSSARADVTVNPDDQVVASFARAFDDVQAIPAAAVPAERVAIDGDVLYAALNSIHWSETGPTIAWQPHCNDQYERGTESAPAAASSCTARLSKAR